MSDQGSNYPRDSKRGEGLAGFINPWLIVPVLYFAQGLPVMLIQGTTGTMLKDLGIENKELALFTAIISWPWVLKMLWGPIVDRSGSKRLWFLLMQMVIAAGIVVSAATFFLPPGQLLTVLLPTLFLVAFMSATHDIAADGYYMLSVSEENQSSFIGIRSAFFRLGTLFATAFLVYLAGRMKFVGWSPQQSWAIAYGAAAAAYTVCLIYNAAVQPKQQADPILKPINWPEFGLRLGQVAAILVGLFMAWRLGYLAIGPTVSKFFGYQFPHEVEKFGTPLFIEKTVAPETLKVASFTGYEQISQPMQVAIAFGFSILGIVAFLNLFRKSGLAEPAREFFKTDRIWAILAFILFFRFGESMVSTLSNPFLQDPHEKGGAGMDLTKVAEITGVWGVVALTVGGILGGALIGKIGIKKCFWPMVLSLNIPNLFYVWAGFNHTAISREALIGLISVDQFGYGFGFSAYLVYLLFVCQNRPNATSLYAIATGLMALGAMVARLSSGFAFDLVKNQPNPYGAFFVIVCCMAIPGMLTLFFVPMNREDLKVAHVEID